MGMDTKGRGRAMRGRQARAARAAMAALGLGLALGVALPASAEPLSIPEGWRMTWHDEFDHDGVPDPARWQFDTGMNKQGWHNHELQYYAGPDGGNALVKGGHLRIVARAKARRDAPDWGGQAYTSARLITRGKAEWTYGFVEIRARLPCGRGTWPALWLLGTGGDWPRDGELDLMEHLGRDPGRVFSTVHMAAGHGSYGVGGAQRVPDACTAFHRYQLRWTKDDVVFGVDGFAHLRYPRLSAGGDAVWPFDRPQFLILNVAIGGDLGGPVDAKALPAVMDVDYVRVWQPVASASDGAASAPGADAGPH